MTYEETLEKIHDLNRFGSRLGLERMEILMRYLGNPEDDLKIIHVAGTNGKGSVCRYLSSSLRACGYRVGMYTSPYLEHFTERIEWEEQPIAENDLIRCGEMVFSQVEKMVAEGLDSPTEFEVVTAIALVYFKEKGSDFVVLEVGLGGTGDSTNVIKSPLACAITSISFDHMQYLGNTLEAIAREKAGIMKEGVPMVCCVKDSEPLEAIREEARRKNAPLYEAALDTIRDVQTSIDGSVFDAEVMGRRSGIVSISMPGRHQIENALCALNVLEVLQQTYHVALPEAAVLSGMKRAVQHGRLEILERNPFVLIDGAHNRAGVEMLERTVREHFQGKKILLIIGILADKEVDEMVRWFVKLGADIAAAEPDNPRKLPARQLCEAVKRHGVSCMVAGNPEEAVTFAKKRKVEYDVVIFAGSLYLIGKIRELWNYGKYQE